MGSYMRYMFGTPTTATCYKAQIFICYAWVVLFYQSLVEGPIRSAFYDYTTLVEQSLQV